MTSDASGGEIRLRVALAEDEAEYIRHARLATLHAIGANPHPALTEPLPYAVYLFAYDGPDALQAVRARRRVTNTEVPQNT